MAGIGIILGIMVFLVTSAFTAEFITKPDATAGCLPALIAGSIVAWPLIRRGIVCRHNFLHPVPRKYKVPVKQAFAAIRDVLSETSYNFGDRWNVQTADVNRRRILASLRFSEEESKIEGSFKNINVQKQRLQRYIEMEVQLTEAAGDSTIVEFSFQPKVEGANWFSCDEIIQGIVRKVEDALGEGVALEVEKTKTKFSPPPWWLLGFGGLAVLSLFSTIMRAIFR